MMRFFTIRRLFLVGGKSNSSSYFVIDSIKTGYWRSDPPEQPPWHMLCAKPWQGKKKRVFIMNRMQKELIQSDPFVMMGKPVIAGTRITVELILEKLAAGETFEQILDAHPRLTREAIQAALAFAAEVLRADVVYPITEVAV